MQRTRVSKTLHGKIFFGWWIVMAVSTLCAVVQGFTSNALTVIFKPLSADLGFTRAATSGAASITRLEGGFEALLSGWLIDRFGPKWVMFVGIFTIGVGLVLMNFIQSLWAYYVVWGVTIATGNNLALTIPVDKTITDWFVKKRGLAMGIKFAFVGIGGIIVVPIATWLTINFGWRTACLIWAVVTFASLSLVVLFIKQRRPEYYGLLPDGAGKENDTSSTDFISRGIKYASESQEVEFTSKQAMKTRAYWFILVATSVAGMVQAAVNLHIFPYLTDRGINETTAGLMLSLMIFSTIPSRFVSGIVVDHVKKNLLPYLLGVSYIITCLGLAILLLVPNIAAVYVFLILFGIGSGANAPIGVLMRARYFGRKAYGSISGISNLIGAPAGVIAPIYAGWVYDTSGSYVTAFAVFAAFPVIAALIICFTRPPELPSPATSTNKVVS